MPTAVNPSTESLRRDNHQREIITQVSAASHSAAEKGVASDKDRARTPAQNNEHVDFANLRKHAEHEVSTIGEQDSPKQGQDEKERQHHHSAQADSDTNAEDNQKQTNIDKQAKLDERIIHELEHRDQEVRAHELAHGNIGGSTTGLPSYTYEVGPDGKKYAVSGEVSVDLSSVPADPQATITKMQKVHAAALAPAHPSSQDVRVAASAAQIILKAQSELMLDLDGELRESNTSTSSIIENSITKLDTAIKYSASDDFDSLINQTLADQEKIAPANTGHMALENHHTLMSAAAENKVIKPHQSSEIMQRAKRVESFYMNITQAYEKPESFQFVLTA